METFSRETFRDYRKIDGYDNYVISNYGEVFNTTSGKVKKPQISNRGGYYYVSLWKNNIEKKFLIHRIVALHFIENPELKPFVDHIDNIRTNNHISNLRWATNGENNFNSGVNVVNTSGHKGVHFRKDTQRWSAKIYYNKKAYNLGCFSTKEEAVKARRERAKELYGAYTHSCEKDDDE
jgi:hypothetical protein